MPLSNLVDARTEARPISLTQMNQLNAATVSAALAPGVTMGQAVAFLEENAAQVMPQGFGIDARANRASSSMKGRA